MEWITGYTEVTAENSGSQVVHDYDWTCPMLYMGARKNGHSERDQQAAASGS